MNDVSCLQKVLMSNFGVLPVVIGLDMNISQFLKSLGLEHLRDIFETEQV